MIHQYIQNGYRLVLDVESGVVLSLDQLSYDLLACCEEENLKQRKLPQTLPEASDAELAEAFGELCELYDQGLLYSAEMPIHPDGINLKNSPIKALCLHVAHDCNLRCKYCFAGTGEFSGPRGMMSLEVGKKAIDFVIRESGARRNIEIDFFGGEPLMNFELCKQLVEYGRQEEKKYDKNIRFTITTNGVLLDDDKIRYINENMDNVVLSIDGRKEVNDRMRHRIDGSGSFDTILPKFKKMADARQQDRYYVRGTFTKYNLDFDRDVLFLADEGFEQISVEPVATDKGQPYAITEEDLPAAFDAYDRLASAMLERRLSALKTGEKSEKPFNFFHFMVDLEQGPCIIKRLRGCGSGNEYVAVTPEGDIYPCHQFVGLKQFRMGNVLSGELNRDIKSEFGGCNLTCKTECRKCWAKYYCSGGCNANNYLYEGDIKKPYYIGCELEKKRLECAIMLQAAEKSVEE